MRIGPSRTVPRRGVPFPVNRSFSGHVRQVRVERVRHCVRVSAGQCIPLAPAPVAHVRWELVQACPHREHLLVPEAVQVVRPAVQVSAMFLVA